MASLFRKTSKPKKALELYVVRLNPACRVVWLYLLQTGLPHKLIDVDPSAGAETPDALTRSPHKQVPILVDGDVLVFEGPAILRYLSYQYTDLAGFGHGIKDHMLVESLISWANSDLHRSSGYCYAYPQFLDKYRLPSDSANEALVESGIKHLTTHLETIEYGYLADNRYLAGDTVTIADIFVATVLKQAEWVGFQFDMWPRVLGWLLELEQEPHWHTVHHTHLAFLEELRHQHFITTEH